MERPENNKIDAEMKLSHQGSILSILEREITGLSEIWKDDPTTTNQRFDDLIALVNSTKQLIK